MYYVYVIENSSNAHYIGQTNDLERRLLEHNDPQFVEGGYTRTRGPWKLIYQEIYKTRSEAMRREKELKSGKGRNELRRMA